MAALFIILILIGCGMIFNGCSSQSENIMQQTYLSLQWRADADRNVFHRRRG